MKQLTRETWLEGEPVMRAFVRLSSDASFSKMDPDDWVDALSALKLRAFRTRFATSSTLLAGR